MKKLFTKNQTSALTKANLTKEKFVVVAVSALVLIVIASEQIRLALLNW